MSAVLVDTNVLVDVLRGDLRWGTWSAAQLASAANSAIIVINPIIYAEVSIGFSRIEDLDAALPGDYFTLEALPWEAAFLAGKAFAHYRRRRGARVHPLPDFYIGAHAAVQGYALLTRDPRRYRTYFPRLTLIAP